MAPLIWDPKEILQMSLLTKTETDSRLGEQTYGYQGEGMVRRLGSTCTHCYI